MITRTTVVLVSAKFSPKCVGTREPKPIDLSKCSTSGGFGVRAEDGEASELPLPSHAGPSDKGGLRSMMTPRGQAVRQLGELAPPAFPMRWQATFPGHRPLI